MTKHEEIAKAFGGEVKNLASGPCIFVDVGRFRLILGPFGWTVTQADSEGVSRLFEASE
jgi:hypothetical protein